MLCAEVTFSQYDLYWRYFHFLAYSYSVVCSFILLHGKIMEQILFKHTLEHMKKITAENNLYEFVKHKSDQTDCLLRQKDWICALQDRSKYHLKSKIFNTIFHNIFLSSYATKFNKDKSKVLN